MPESLAACRSPHALRDPRAVEYPRATALQANGAACGLLSEHAVDRGARRSGELGEILLAQRHEHVAVHASVRVGELEQPLAHARLRRGVERVEQLRAELA